MMRKRRENRIRTGLAVLLLLLMMLRPQGGAAVLAAAEQQESTEQLSEDAEQQDNAEQPPADTEEQQEEAFEITCPYCCLMDADSGRILYEKEMDVPGSPASMTKIMTTYTALKYGNLSDVVTMTETGTALAVAGLSNLYTQVGEEFTLEQLLYGTMVKSANDMATQVGEYIGGGSLEHFTEMMNEEAAKLGCTNTHFANACGYPDDDNYTSVHDLAIMSREALKNEMFRTLCSTNKYVIPPTNMTNEERVFTTHILMKIAAEYRYEGVFGGKTGYTDLAGSCVAVYCERDGRTLISVIRQAPSQDDLLKDSAKVLTYGYEQYDQLILHPEGFPEAEVRATVTRGVTPEQLTFEETVEEDADGVPQHVFRYLENGTEAGSFSLPEEEYRKATQPEPVPPETSEPEPSSAAEEAGGEAMTAEAESGASEGASPEETDAAPEETPAAEPPEGQKNTLPRTLSGWREWIGNRDNLMAAAILGVAAVVILAGLIVFVRDLKRQAQRRRRRREAKKRKEGRG